MQITLPINDQRYNKKLSKLTCYCSFYESNCHTMQSCGREGLNLNTEDKIDEKITKKYNNFWILTSYIQFKSKQYDYDRTIT